METNFTVGLPGRAGKVSARCRRAIVHGIAFCLVVLGSLAAWHSARAQQTPDSTARTHRRILVNDDGEVTLPEGGQSWDDYLGQRFAQVVGTQVDTYFLNIGATDRGPGIVHSLQSSMAYWAAEKKIPPRYVEATRRYIGAARKAKIEIFASIRMNDVHDSTLPGAANLTYPLKIGRPDLLLGSPDEVKMGRRAFASDSVMYWFWSGLNFAEDEVRQHFLDFIAFYCPQFDFDGVELDFFRHPLFFRLGEEDENAQKMTQFVRQVRATLEEIGRKRRRPYRLAVRVPDTPAFARRTGLHVEQWLEEGLIDLLVVGGGYMPYSGRLKEFIDMAHRYRVPAYPCLNHFRGPVQMQTVASNFWALGADGFYLFNYFGVTGREVNPGWGASEAVSLQCIGSPETLRRLTKRYKPDPGIDVAYVGYNQAPGQLPVYLLHGTPVELVVGDHIGQAQAAGQLAEARLQVTVTDLRPKASITVVINGDRIPHRQVKRVDKGTFAVDVASAPLRRGVNRLVFLPGPGSSGRLSSQITQVELTVRYKEP